MLSDEQLLECVSERNKSRDTIKLLIDTLLNVSYCFDSVPSQAINESHPSCREYIHNVVARVRKKI